MAKEYLITRYERTGLDDFSDFFYIIAKNIEDSLQTAGAIPGEDYTILDIYKLAQPFVLHRFQSQTDGKFGFNLSWPD
jgi:hypothetical protein